MVAFLLKGRYGLGGMSCAVYRLLCCAGLFVPPFSVLLFFFLLLFFCSSSLLLTTPTPARSIWVLSLNERLRSSEIAARHVTSSPDVSPVFVAARHFSSSPAFRFAM